MSITAQTNETAQYEDEFVLFGKDNIIYPEYGRLLSYSADEQQSDLGGDVIKQIVLKPLYKRLFENDVYINQHKVMGYGIEKI